MDYTIEGGSTFPLVRVTMNAGETLKAERGAMVALSQGAELKGKMDGGLKRSIGRIFTGESFFLQSIEAKEDNAWALLSTTQLGAISALDVGGQEWCLQKNGFVAAASSVDISTKMQSIGRSLFSGEGMFIMRVKGDGTLFVSTYGSMQTVSIPAGESVLIDNGHLVAWPAHMKYDIAKGASSWISSATSGEGLACRFHGPGDVIIQTRNPRDFGAWLQQFLPPPPRSN